MSTKATETKAPKASKAYEDAVSALRKCSEGDDEEAAKAKRMLKAELDDAPPPPDDKTKDEPPPAEEKAKGEEPAAIAARVSRLEANQAAEKAKAAAAAIAAERAQLLASRPDLPTALAAALAKPTASIESVREIVETHPRGKLPNPAAAGATIGTRGATQGDPTSPASSPEAQAMDAAMGLAAPRGGVRMQGTAQIFSVLDADRLEPKPAAKTQ